MKNFTVVLSLVLLALASCSKDEPVQLSFSPSEGTQIIGTYAFTVNQLKSGDVTEFKSAVAGFYGKGTDGKHYLEVTNQNITLQGNVKGKPVNAIAGVNDTLLDSEVRLLAMPIFSTAGKDYRIVFDKDMNKLTEFQVKNGKYVDSSESRIQFLLRYPAENVSPGQSWERDIVLKAGNRMNCSAKYTLERIAGDTAFIRVDGKIYGQGESFGTLVSFDGKLNGNFKVKKTEGTPYMMDVTEEFNLRINGDSIPMIYSIRANFR